MGYELREDLAIDDNCYRIFMGIQRDIQSTINDHVGKLKEITNVNSLAILAIVASIITIICGDVAVRSLTVCPHLRCQSILVVYDPKNSPHKFAL